MGARRLLQFTFGLGQRYVQPAAALLCIAQHELRSQGRLAGPWIAFEQIHLSRRQAAMQDLVEPFYSCLKPHGL
jgi:hypothetical protein